MPPPFVILLVTGGHPGIPGTGPVVGFKPFPGFYKLDEKAVSLPLLSRPSVSSTFSFRLCLRRANRSELLQKYDAEKGSPVKPRP